MKRRIILCTTPVRTMTLLSIMILTVLPIAVYAEPQVSIQTGDTMDTGLISDTVEPYEPISENLPCRIYTPEITAPQSPGTITISGTLKYISETSAQVPMRWVRVVLMDDDIGTDETVATKYTDYNGYFSFVVNNYDGLLQGGRDPYVKVYSENGAAYCKDANLNWYISQLPKCGNDVPDGFTYNYGVRVPASNSEAWLVIDACLSEYDWIYYRSSPNWHRASKVEVRWPFEGGAHSHGNNIHLGSTRARHVTVQHEYGHCVMYALYGHFPPGSGGGHNVWSEINEGFAICEGWAEFMGCAVDNLKTNLQGTYNGHGGNIETNDWYNCIDEGTMDGYLVEGSVASIFWDINDGTSESDQDFLSWGFDEIFTVIRYDQPDSIDQFWTAWKARWSTISSSIGPLCTIYWYYGIDKDTYAPYYATLYINSATTAYTNSVNAHLHIYCRDAGRGVAYMRLAAGRILVGSRWVYLWGPWQTYATYVSPWTLAAGDGTKYVFAQFKDYKGYISQVYSDSVILDTVKPVVTDVSVYPGSFPYAWRIYPPPVRRVYTSDHTHINFTLSEPSYVTIRIYNNQTGALVRTLLSSKLPILQPAGLNSIVWDGRYSNGTGVPNGLYKISIYVKDRAGNFANPYPIVTYVTVFYLIVIIP